MGASEGSSRADRLRVLAGQQEALLASCEPNVFASLSREYRATLTELEAVAPGATEKGSPLDELEKRRSGRRAAG